MQYRYSAWNVSAAGATSDKNEIKKMAASENAAPANYSANVTIVARNSCLESSEGVDCLTIVAQNSCPESSKGVDCYNSYNSAAAKVSDKIIAEKVRDKIARHAVNGHGARLHAVNSRGNYNHSYDSTAAKVIDRIVKVVSAEKVSDKIALHAVNEL